MATPSSADDCDLLPTSSGSEVEPSPRDSTDVPLLLSGDPPVLTPAQQESLLHLLLRGASPAVACQQLGVPVFSFDAICQANKEFARQAAQVYDILSRNVLAALYRAAMQGNVSAQTFWLKTSPPPGWAKPETGLEADPLDELSDRELIELARAIVSNLPRETETEADRVRREAVPEILPPGDSDLR